MVLVSTRSTYSHPKSLNAIATCSYTAVISGWLSRNTPPLLTAAETQTTFLSLCVYGLVNRTITYWQLNSDVTLCVQSDRH